MAPNNISDEKETLMPRCPYARRTYARAPAYIAYLMRHRTPRHTARNPFSDSPTISYLVVDRLPMRQAERRRRYKAALKDMEAHQAAWRDSWKDKEWAIPLVADGTYIKVSDLPSRPNIPPAGRIRNQSRPC